MVSEPQYESATSYSKERILITQMQDVSQMIQYTIETVILSLHIASPQNTVN